MPNAISHGYLNRFTMSVCHATSIGLDDAAIEFSGPQGAHWRVPVSAIRALGEFRDLNEEHGHFLAVIFDTTGAWLQAPCNAIGMDRLLTQLSQRWGASLELELAHSSTDHSRVMWPAELSGLPLFDAECDRTTRNLNPALRQT